MPVWCCINASVVLYTCYFCVVQMPTPPPFSPSPFSLTFLSTQQVPPHGRITHKSYYLTIVPDSSLIFGYRNKLCYPDLQTIFKTMFQILKFPHNIALKTTKFFGLTISCRWPVCQVNYISMKWTTRNLHNIHTDSARAIRKTFLKTNFYFPLIFG